MENRNGSVPARIHLPTAPRTRTKGAPHQILQRHGQCTAAHPPLRSVCARECDALWMKVCLLGDSAKTRTPDLELLVPPPHPLLRGRLHHHLHWFH
ncbi:hypothetical protein M405DRAFT_581181 [Rhizopogon salebrosus TDB-379]|nr:hypothetical protein M405DRAFT_581181 [Rhizopogon salebrosus TDB-379]